MDTSLPKNTVIVPRAHRHRLFYITTILCLALFAVGYLLYVRNANRVLTPEEYRQSVMDRVSQSSPVSAEISDAVMGSISKNSSASKLSAEQKQKIVESLNK